jgi:hypothetical protein
MLSVFGNLFEKFLNDFLCLFDALIIQNSNFLNFLIHSKIVELEEELRVVGNNLKSLEVSEEKVIFMFTIILY